MKKKIVVMVCIMMIIGLVGCSQKSEGTSTAEVGKEILDPIEIELFNQKPEIKELLDTMIAEYNASQNNIIIQQTCVPEPYVVLQTRLSSGDIPEILTHWPNAAFKEQVAAGLYMDLSHLECLNNVSDEVIEETKIDNKNYCVPISFNTVGIYYNKDMFKEHGWNVPSTYTELIKLCEQIQSEGKEPLVGIGNKDAGAVFQGAMSLFYQMGSYDAFIEDTKQNQLDLHRFEDELIEVGNKILELYAFTQEGSMGAENSQLVSDFANEKVAMYISGSWQIPQIIAANPELNFEMFPFPAEKAGTEIAGVFSGDFSLAVSAKTKHVEYIADFLSYMTSTEVAEQYARVDGSASCIKGVEYVAPALERQYEAIKSGRIASYPNENWTSGTSHIQAGESIQELLVTHDIEAWVQNFRGIFVK